MSRSLSSVKKLCQLSVVAMCLICVPPSYAAGESSWLMGLGKIWISITTPIGSFFGLGPSLATIDQNAGVLVGYVHRGNMVAMAMKGKEYVAHDNIFIKILTFGNSRTLANLNAANIAGKEYMPYAIFAYNKSGSHYIASHLDAGSIVLYGVSWFMHIPAKLLDQIDANIYIESNKNPMKRDAVGRSIIFPHLIDCCINLLSLVVEIPIAIVNTVIGSIIALIWHPIDSICSILGLIYMLIATFITSLWGIVANIVMIPYHLLFA